MECVVGHCTFLGLLRRESLAVFHTICRYIQRYGEQFAPLWPSVRDELRAFRGLMPLLESELSLGWSPVLSAYEPKKPVRARASPQKPAVLPWRRPWKSSGLLLPTGIAGAELRLALRGASATRGRSTSRAA